jgi:hypothetical protein
MSPLSASPQMIPDIQNDASCKGYISIELSYPLSITLTNPRGHEQYLLQI